MGSCSDYMQSIVAIQHDRYSLLQRGSVAQATRKHAHPCILLKRCTMHHALNIMQVWLAGSVTSMWRRCMHTWARTCCWLSQMGG